MFLYTCDGGHHHAVAGCCDGRHHHAVTGMDDITMLSLGASLCLVF